jgi:hypothetical protein
MILFTTLGTLKDWFYYTHLTDEKIVAYTGGSIDAK